MVSLNALWLHKHVHKYMEFIGFEPLHLQKLQCSSISTEGGRSLRPHRHPHTAAQPPCSSAVLSRCNERFKRETSIVPTNHADADVGEAASIVPLWSQACPSLVNPFIKRHFGRDPQPSRDD